MEIHSPPPVVTVRRECAERLLASLYILCGLANRLPSNGSKFLLFFFYILGLTHKNKKNWPRMKEKGRGTWVLSN
jgi:hypothetical protein